MSPVPPQPLPRVPTTEEIVPAMQRIIDEFNIVRAQILDTTTPATATFDNTMIPLAHVEDAVQGEIAMIDMLQYGSPSLATQDAFNVAQKLYNDARASWTADAAFFSLLQAVRTKEQDFNALDPESQHLLDRELLDYHQAGHGVLSPTDLEIYLRRRSEITELERQFQQNLAREDGGVKFTLEELDGVPREELAKWRDCDNDGSGEDENSKRKFVPFANGGTMTVLTNANRSETRKKMFLADSHKLGENKPLFEEIIRRRAKQARFLEYPSHADFRIKRRMVKTTAWLRGFLDQLKEKLCPLGRDEVGVLQRRRVEDLRARGQDTDNGSADQRVGNGFPPWDKRYYEKLVQQDFEIDQLHISEFFPLEQTATGMLGIFAKVLDLRFEPVSVPTDDLKDVIWYDNVRVFSVWNSTNDDETIGYLYFDLLWRENKYRGNQSVNLQCGYEKPDRSRQYPATILMCSFPTSTPTSCTLLKHHQVVTLFHEMGHGIHDLLARTKYTRFHGYRLPPDFGEMPSMMLENWCWMKDVLQDLSCHYTTLDETYLSEWRKQNPGKADPPTTIPGELVDNIIRHRHFNQSLYYLHILSISLFDLQIHTTNTDDIDHLDVQKLWYDIRGEIEFMDYSECRDGYGFGTFSHLTAGYDVCYYAYLCCAAMAQDVFTSVFAADPFDKEIWDRYRRAILQSGGSKQDLLGMLEDFLGRPVNMNALVETLTRAASEQ
ncbi:peptidase family M3 [Aspergillus heteromorphus CBS 117.55]|uniref:Peptidase family M3 n=1 Tax=Aspergillus heteromorphus CBS 117.55 TaxID=1448321 RepID=A0A317X344_9EURO|nr:peptidase family M3 [Aspergillus heteromorphus CBS 117.55]PWY90980.1 peptidase family M3 [Aspergillus heteromorphus CBS 117.55]